jgi:uncharacterized membrane protein YedE/YeeE
MGGAIAVGVVAFRQAGHRQRSLLGAAMWLPTANDIDRRLVLGSIAFGVGWGLAGLCPGPALVSLSLGSGQAFVFVIAMLAGMAIFELSEKASVRHAKQPAQ